MNDIIFHACIWRQVQEPFPGIFCRWINTFYICPITLYEEFLKTATIIYEDDELHSALYINNDMGLLNRSQKLYLMRFLEKWVPHQRLMRQRSPQVNLPKLTVSYLDSPLDLEWWLLNLRPSSIQPEGCGGLRRWQASLLASFTAPVLKEVDKRLHRKFINRLIFVITRTCFCGTAELAEKGHFIDIIW